MVLYIEGDSMLVFVSGGTGYIGRQVVCDLIDRGHRVRALVRSGSEAKLPAKCDSNISVITGDIQQLDALRGVLDGCDGVIHLPGLIREYPRLGITFRGVQYSGSKNIIDEAVRGSVKRFILVSANGVRPGARTTYQLTKWMAEEYLRQSGLEWTIFRPSIVFGNENEGYENFITVLIRQLHLVPLIVPVPGDGRFLFQPVSINNLSEGITKSLLNRIGIGTTYEVGGSERFSFDEMLDIVAGILNIHKRKLHQPVRLLRLFARAFRGYSFFPISEDQLLMLIEGNVTQREKKFFEDFTITPIRLIDALKLTLSSMK